MLIHLSRLISEAVQVRRTSCIRTGTSSIYSKNWPMTPIVCFELVSEYVLRHKAQTDVKKRKYKSVQQVNTSMELLHSVASDMITAYRAHYNKKLKKASEQALESEQ